MLISVIIPVYNRSTELQRAIRSVLAQTLQDFEILVVDDFSEEDIEKVVRQFADPRVRYIRSEKKGNANVCRNKGLSLALGKYTAMLDSDDEWLPFHLEKKIALLERDGADGVFGGCLVNDGSSIKRVISRPFRDNENMVHYLLTDGKAATPSHVYKTACARETGWDEELLRHQDYDFSIRFSDKFSFIPSQDLTVIIHWKKGESRTLHINSLLRFIEKYRARVGTAVRMKYFRERYILIAEKPGVSIHLKQLFFRGALEDITYISLREYLALQNKTGRFVRMIHRIRYVLKVLFK